MAEEIEHYTSQAVKAEDLAAAWDRLEFTADPLAATLKGSAEHAAGVGLLRDKPADDFAKLWDLKVLNEALAARGATQVNA